MDEKIVKDSRGLVKDLVNDCISRRAAIDATWFEPSYTDPLNVLAEVRDRLKELPSAQPEHRWIPVTVRLPKDYEDVLVWYEYFKYGEYNRMVQTCDVGYYISEFNRWGGVTGQKVRAIAWMPLPEPYKEDDHD